MTSRQRAARKAELLQQIARQRQQLATAGQDWIAATRSLDHGWLWLVRHRHLALVGGGVLLLVTLRRRDRLARAFRRHRGLLLSVGGWLLTRR